MNKRNSGRACEFLKRELLINKRHLDAEFFGGGRDFINVDNKFKLADSINTVCKHVDNVREITYGRNADWRDYSDRNIEDSIMREKSPYFGKYTSSELKRRGYPQGAVMMDL